MNKNNYLTKQEQHLYTTLKHTDIIDHTTLQELFPTIATHTINKLIHNLIKKGYLYALKKGYYLINQTPTTQPLITNPFRIASYLTSGYLGFSSALRIYDLIDYEPFTIFIVTKNKSKQQTIANYLFKTVALGEKATGATYYKNLYVSTLEKTLFDCFTKPHYAGGYHELIKILTQTKNLNWTILHYYFTTYASPALFQRSGYILELLDNKNLITLPPNIIQQFKTHIKNNTRLIPTGPHKGTYIKEWKLLDNQGKNKLLSEVN